MKKGFTLIELLVVIAIIAILAAILFPVFAQAREKARQTSCLSNVKQIGTAVQLYVDDYDETLPFGFKQTGWPGAEWNEYPRLKLGPIQDPNGSWGPSYTTYLDEIFPYVKNLNMFVCPSFRTKCNWDNYKNNLCPGYGYNYWLKNEGWPLANLKNTAQMVFVSDTNHQYVSSSWYLAKVATPDYLLNTHNYEGWLTADRHNGGSNFCFADGHAKYYKVGSGPYERINGAMNSGWDSAWWNPDQQK